ncbi:hypothetical protein JNW90_21170 [Micromonospora sp. STR1s_5]|nr:hypothetical protein [Micromonospora sp. STR1s_5]
MTTVTRHALRVYAALSGLKDAGGDVVDALIPFMEPVLEVMHGKIFNPTLLALGVQKLYGGSTGTLPNNLQGGCSLKVIYVVRHGRSSSSIFSRNLTAKTARSRLRRSSTASSTNSRAFPRRSLTCSGSPSTATSSRKS